MSIAIINGKLILDDEVVENKVLVFNSKIIDIVDEIPEKSEVLDAKGLYVSPGFIDIHIHGISGADVMDGTFEALNTISNSVLKSGTTSFLATTMTMSQNNIDNALNNIMLNTSKVTGANLLGTHLEGPFINIDKLGAQNSMYVQEANFEFIEKYINSIKMITLAPEVGTNKRFIEFMKLHYPEVILSIGHSNATYDECCDFINNGISHATHMFNAMSSYHHREPGIIGAVFDNEDVTCDVIADLIHVHPSSLKLLHNNKKNNLITITDSMRAACMKNGMYELGEQNVEVKDGKAILENGQLAGSVLSMNMGVRNMLQYGGMSFIEAINSATKIPANKLNIPKGELKVGYDADIIIFDESFNIEKTIVGGVVKYD